MPPYSCLFSCWFLQSPANDRALADMLSLFMDGKYSFCKRLENIPTHFKQALFTQKIKKNSYPFFCPLWYTYSKTDF